MLQDAVEQEVDEFLGRLRYERKGVFRGYRQRPPQARSIGVGMSAVEVCSDACNRFWRRLGVGGSCPGCDDIITLEELLALDPLQGHNPPVA